MKRTAAYGTAVEISDKGKVHPHPYNIHTSWLMKKTCDETLLFCSAR